MNRNGITIFVNRAWSRPADLHAIHEAYRNILPPAVFSRNAAFLEMPYDKSTSTCIRKNRSAFPALAICSRFVRDAIRQR